MDESAYNWIVGYRGDKKTDEEELIFIIML